MLADLLEECWHLLIGAALAPAAGDLLTADVAYRTQVLADYGLERVLDDLHPRVHWAGQALVIDQMPVGPGRSREAGLLLIPSVFLWPSIAVVTGRPPGPRSPTPARGIAGL